MSLSNSILEKIIKYKNNCNHEEQLRIYGKKNKSYFYCYDCNNIILIINDKSYTTLKYLIDDEDINYNLEFDPVIATKLMIKRHEEQMKYINDKLVLLFSNNDFENNSNLSNNNSNNNSSLSKTENLDDSGITNIDEAERIEKEKELKNNKNINNKSNIDDSLKNDKIFRKFNYNAKNFDKYDKKRNTILNYINKLYLKLKYNDNSFYLCLYLSDIYLSKFYSDNIKEKDLFLIILGFFLISSKYIEDDIFEPELQLFCNIEKSILLTLDEIRSSEVQCLHLINYNFYLYSPYDWLNTLLSNGIVFENEIKEEKEIENIYNYTQELLVLITTKTYYFKYSSIQIALSIIQLSRDKFLKKNKFSEKLFKLLISLYGFEFKDYEECYNIIKQDLEDNESDEEENDNTKSNINLNNNNKRNKNYNTNINNIDIKKNRSNDILNEGNTINLNITERINKFKINLNSNKVRKYINSEHNLASTINNNKTKYTLNAISNKTKFSIFKNKIKSRDKSLPNNLVNVFNNNFKNLTTNTLTNESNDNSSFNIANYNTSETKKNLMKEGYKMNKHFIIKGKNEKENKHLNIDKPNKLSIKKNNHNINNINFINNININNEIINLYTGNKLKKLNEDIISGLNFNFIHKINKNNNKNYNIGINKNNISLIKKTLFDLNKKNKGEKNDIKINNKIKEDNKSDIINIPNTQNIIPINNDKNSIKSNKFNKNNKQKYKTHILLDMANNINGNIIYNKNDDENIIIPTEKENKSCNKYTFNGYNNLNNNKKAFKINLNGKNEIKVMNTNININLNNQISSRKFKINFRDIVNKKISKEKEKNYISKDNDKYKTINYNNDNSKNKLRNNKTNILSDNIGINNKMIEKNTIFKNKIINYKNLDNIDSKLPILNLNKKSFLSLNKK